MKNEAEQQAQPAAPQTFMNKPQPVSRMERVREWIAAKLDLAREQTMRRRVVGMYRIQTQQGSLIAGLRSDLEAANTAHLTLTREIAALRMELQAIEHHLGLERRDSPDGTYRLRRSRR